MIIIIASLSFFFNIAIEININNIRSMLFFCLIFSVYKSYIKYVFLVYKFYKKLEFCRFIFCFVFCMFAHCKKRRFSVARLRFSVGGLHSVMVGVFFFYYFHYINILKNTQYIFFVCLNICFI